METALLGTQSPADLAAAVEAAVAALAAGDVVALPTETVYGLAADALRAEAVAKIYEAKERPNFDPLILHLPNQAWLERVVCVPRESRALVDALVARFWPGPLTLVLPRQEVVPDVVTAGLSTVAVRMSAHPVFGMITRQFGKPLAAPSANRFGRISPTAASHVLSELAGRIPLIIDGGPTEHGIESTIVAVQSASMKLLRAGPVTPDELTEIQVKLHESSGRQPNDTEELEFLTEAANPLRPKPLAPGQLKSHYAPRTPLALTEDAAESARHLPMGRYGLLGLAPKPGADYGGFAHLEWLSVSGDMREAAATLFAKLRRLDEAHLQGIIAEHVPEEGLGIAIMDRLRKASHRERIECP